MKHLFLALLLALAVTAGAASSETIGIANHNPGNLRDIHWRAWKGAVGIDKYMHMKFRSDFWGLRAIRLNLESYGAEGHDTPRKVAVRWGSLKATPAQRAEYTLMLCNFTGCKADEKLNMNDRQVLKRLARGIVREENGADPYSASLYDRAFPSH